MATFSIDNISSGDLTYQGITITAGTSYAVPDDSSVAFASDPELFGDIISLNVTITIGSSTLSGAAASRLMELISNHAPSVGFLPISGSADALDEVAFETDAVGYTTAYITTYVTGSGATTVTGMFESSLNGTDWFQVPYQLVTGLTTPSEAVASIYFVESGSARDPASFKVRVAGKHLRLRLDYYDGSGSTINSTAYLVSADSQDTFGLTKAVLTDWLGNSPTVGHDTMSASLSVAIASDQTAIPISVASLPLPSGAATESTLSALNAKLSALGQTTMSASMPVTIASNQSAVPVSGTFWQATQPVSGTFWQATQPISAAALPLPTGASTDVAQGSTTSGQTGALIQGAVTTSAPSYTTAKTNPLSLTTAGALRVDGSAVTQPVSGTFWQATQPVSGTFWQTTQPVSLSAGATAIAKAEDSASADADVGVPAMAIRKATPANTSGTDGDYEMLQMSAGRLWASATIDSALPAGTNRIGSVRLVDSSDADLTTTKATQPSRVVGTQSLKDSGRTHINLYAVAAAAGTTTTETAITLTKSSGTSATSTGTSFVITNGKRFRITYISVATRGHSTATIQTTTFNLRINTGGAVTTSSTPVVLAARSATPATASAWDRVIVPLGDGFEILGDGTLQFGITAAATYTTNAPTWDVTIMGYEY